MYLLMYEGEEEKKKGEEEEWKIEKKEKIWLNKRKENIDIIFDFV